ncbi:MAG: PKD domain-containing protein [Candidatus Symbiothrix sp.]|jgi:PKD repeat protein|nr:PKD domain-containing protein [Candidatus Symbiothrix sp.]
MKHCFYVLFLILICFSCHEEQIVPVEIDVALHVKNDHTSPLSVAIENKTRNATNFLWTFEGGEPATSFSKNPKAVLFTTPGNHAITVEAWNDGHRASQTYTIRVDSMVTVDFLPEVDINNYAPATFKITNQTTGASSYHWTFQGGVPASYEGQFPPAITYAQKGNYIISLTVENGSASFTHSKEIEVRESLDASFAIVPSFEDEDDMEAPLRATFNAQLQGVETLRWECAGATITNETSEEASIYFPSEGKYTVYLEVFNGKETKQVSQAISINANTNLRTHHDIRLGINTAHETFPVYYSTQLRRLISISETKTIGSSVDIVYYGLNAGFSYNRFVSPDQLEETSHAAIPDAKATKFINRTELGNIAITPAQFNVMTTDALLRDLPIAAIVYGDEPFSNNRLPHIVLFETSDKRKGAILVKEMVSDGAKGSYITIDIKVQKND